MTETRRIGETEFTTPNDVEVVIRRVVEAPLGRVWQAWTDPVHIPRWMLGPPGWSMPVCEMDVRPGGAWRFVWRRPEGAEMGMHGVYSEVVPEARLVTTEAWGGSWPETVNTLDLEEDAGRTTITQTVRYASRKDRDAALGTGMREGANQSLDRLVSYLAVSA